MKKGIFILGLLLTVTFFFSGCQSEGDEENGKLKVMASFYTMADFSEKIGGDKVDVVNMVPAGTEPHDWEPSPKDIVALEKADIFVYSGGGMEHWTDDVLESLESENLVVVETTDGVQLLESQASEEGEEEHFDPHVWLAPQNAQQQMRNIANALIEADPENKDYYESNFEEYAEKLKTLDEKFRAELREFSRRDIVVSHEAYGYLCKVYGLKQIAIEGLSAESEPDPARMAEIIDLVKEENIKVIFFETLVDSKVAKSIAEATGAEVQVLNPIEGLTKKEVSEGKDYFSTMEANLEALKNALKN